MTTFDGRTAADTARAVAGAALAPSPQATEGQDDTGHPKRWWILAVLAAVAFMAQLDLFIVNIALPAIGRSYRRLGLSGLSWVLNGYAIVFAALLVPAGRLADHFGRRRFLLIGVLSSRWPRPLCAPRRASASWSGRAGAGRRRGADRADLARPALPVVPRGTSTRWWWASGPGSRRLPPPPGPPIGGLLVGVDWRWIFLINLPIGVGHADRRHQGAARGARGTGPGCRTACRSLLLAAVTLLVLATVQGPLWGWTSARAPSYCSPARSWPSP
jgi:MFS family permease